MVRVGRILIHVLLVSVIFLSVCLVSCNESNGTTTIPETTKVLNETTLDSLSGASVNSSILTFENVTEQLSSLSVGDVIVCGVSDVTPYGLLRKVTDIGTDGNQVTVETVNATLEDAIQDCSIDTSWRLQSDGSFIPLGTSEPSDALIESAQPLATGFYLQLSDVVLYDDDGNPGTTTDQITADLSVNLNIDVDIGWTISWFRVTEAHLQATISVTSEIDASFTVTVLEIHPKLEVHRQYLAPFTVMVGPVPVVFLPMLSINIGLDGELSAGITAGVTGNAELTAGVQYEDGDWSPIADFSTSFDWQEPSLTAGCEVKVYAGPQLSLLLYGQAGPYVEVRGYLELDADIFSTPWWELYGGLEADVGFKVEAMGHEIADYEYPLAIGYRVLLAQAEAPAPVTLTTLSTTGGSVTTPGEGSFTYDSGTAVDLVAVAEEGYYFVNWSGDVGTIADTNDPTTTITIIEDCSITANFEIIVYGSITAHKFNDLNSDGDQDGGEPDLSDWTMSLYSGSGCSGELVDSASTDGDGNVVFTGLEAGTYSVKETLKDGWINTTGLCQQVTIDAGGSATLAFGNVEINPDINVVKTAFPNSGAAGTNVVFTITVENTGGLTLAPVKIVDTIPAGMSYMPTGTTPVPDSSTENPDGTRTITWNNIGSLTPGSTTTIYLVAHIDGDELGTLINSVTATGTPPYGPDVEDTDIAVVMVITAVNARIEIHPPHDINVVGDLHELTAIIETSTNGIDWVPYAGATVTFEVTTGPGNLYPVTDITDVNGWATTTLTSTEAGVSTITASTIVDGFTLSTDGTGYNSNPAEKEWVY